MEGCLVGLWTTVTGLDLPVHETRGGRFMAAHWQGYIPTPWVLAELVAKCDL